MVDDMKVRVENLAQISRALRRVDSEAPKQLRITLNETSDLLISKVRPEIPARSGAARSTLKARSTRTSARIALGGKKAPYTPWLDFGGQGRIAGRPAPRPFITEGRYLYPTAVRIRPQIVKSLEDGIRDVVRNAGLDVN